MTEVVVKHSQISLGAVGQPLRKVDTHVNNEDRVYWSDSVFMPGLNSGLA